MLRVLENLAKTSEYLTEDRIKTVVEALLIEFDKELTEVNFVFIPGSKLEDLSDELAEVLVELAQEEADDIVAEDDSDEDDEDDEDFDIEDDEDDENDDNSNNPTGNKQD